MAGRTLPNEAKSLLLRHLATAMYLTASKDKVSLQDRLQHTGTNWAICSKASPVHVHGPHILQAQHASLRCVAHDGPSC